MERYYDLSEELTEENETNAAVTEVKDENGGVPGSAIAGLVDATSSGVGAAEQEGQRRDSCMGRCALQVV